MSPATLSATPGVMQGLKKGFNSQDILLVALILSVHFSDSLESQAHDLHHIMCTAICQQISRSKAAFCFALLQEVFDHRQGHCQSVTGGTGYPATVAQCEVRELLQGRVLGCPGRQVGVITILTLV